ncbi:MAG: hypothetical protein ACT4PI_13455 [Actinomycetota bacterium]
MGYGGLGAGPGPMPGNVLGEYGRAQAQGAAAEHHVPSPEVLRGLDDEKLRRKLRRRLSFWRLFRRVR